VLSSCKIDKIGVLVRNYDEKAYDCRRCVWNVYHMRHHRDVHGETRESSLSAVHAVPYNGDYCWTIKKINITMGSYGKIGKDVDYIVRQYETG
jgi:hypothetical protein